jgi:hypothetical protein
MVDICFFYYYMLCIVLSCCVVFDRWVGITRVILFYPGRCGNGTKPIPWCGWGYGWRVLIQDTGAGLVNLYRDPMGMGDMM